MSTTNNEIAGGILGCALLIGIALMLAMCAGVVFWIWKHALA